MSRADSQESGSRLLHIFVGGLSFGLLACAYAPLSWTAVVFFASAPWFALAAARPGRGFGFGYAAGMIAWGGTLLCWLSSLAGAGVAGFIGWIAVTGIFLVLSAPFGWAMGFLIRRSAWPMTFIVPLSMTAFDALRRFASTGIAWHDPGYVLHGWPEWIQVADLARVYPLSFLLWAINGLVADFLLIVARSARRPAAKKFAISAVLCVLGVVGVVAYGRNRIESIDKQLKEGPKICGIQPNISQAERLVPGASYSEQRYQKCLELMAEAAARETDVDLFVWPETSFFRVDDSQIVGNRIRRGAPLIAMLNQKRRSTQRSVAEEFRDAVQLYSEMPKFLLGLVTYDDMPKGAYDEGEDGIRERNTAVLVDFAGDSARQGTPFLRATHRADKQKLVPFGEYIPFRSLSFKRAEFVAWVKRTAGYLPAMTAGDETVLWKTSLGGRNYQFSVNICYEVVFPEIFAAGRRKGAEFIINTSNDAWYDDSAERDLCNAQIRFRAVENRLGILRLSNTGISSFVDPLGRPAPGMLGKNEKGTLSAKISVGVSSPYAVVWGLWAEKILIFSLFASLFFARGGKSK